MLAPLLTLMKSHMIWSKKKSHMKERVLHKVNKYKQYIIYVWSLFRFIKLVRILNHLIG